MTSRFYLTYLSNSPSVQFKATSGWVTLDRATMEVIGNAVGAHVQACFAAECAIDADIAAGTITTVAQIDGDPRWPTSS